MSDVQNTTAAPAVAAVEPVVEPVAATEAAPVAATEPKVDDAAAPAATTATTTEAAADEPKTEAAAPATEEAKPEEEKAVEPITEGQLAYKGPGLIKSLVPTKKEFWLSDEAVAPQNLDLYLRGEKAEISHAVVAWASQTGKGLLFVNKKNDTDRTHPADVLALYDATDLKKQAPHEFSFKLNGHNHTFKATSDAERDGWYLSVEKAIELGKASKEEIRETEGYKSELEKLSKPTTAVAAGRSQSKAKKSTDADKPAAEGEEATEEAQKKQKSRSTSRGMLSRFKGKKEEHEEKAAEKEAEKEEAKADKEETPVADTTEAAPVVAATTAADIPAAQEAAAATEEKPAETTDAEEKPAEKPKPTKRGSIFGKVSSTWGSMKSPAKEKEQKDAELKPEAAKEGVVSENPPVLPETATTEGATETAVPAVEEPSTEAKATEAPKEEVLTPSKEKGNFLSGLGFMKRNRSVSPSTAMKEPAKKEEVKEDAPKTEEAAAVEPVKAEETATEPVAAAETTDAADKVEEPKKEETANKRQSVLGSLGRRASKAFKGIQAPRKETPAASTEAKKEEETAAEVKPTEETPAAQSETKATETDEAQKSIGDVVPDAVNVGQPQQQAPTVAASA